MADEFKPARAADVTDLELLPKRFDFFASETRDMLAVIVGKLDRIAVVVERTDRHAIDAHQKIVRILERLAGIEDAAAELEHRLAALEPPSDHPPIVPIRRKAARK